MHDDSGVRYINSGDRLKSCLAALEHEDGQFEINRWMNGSRSLSSASSAAEALA
jgi:hypothetical protein